MSLDPSVHRDSRAPEEFRVQVETTQGEILVDVVRAWSPHGADRFFTLVKRGFYDDNAFFRINRGTWAQFGIPGDPRIAQLWRSRMLPDDPRVAQNTRGTLAYAFKEPNGRSTQVFINLRDNRGTHDDEPFVPFGTVISGMDVADALYAEYGERSGGGIRAGRQDPLFEGGNEYLAREFPRLDYIRHARVVE